jgi:hypothetical protein
MPIVPLLVPVMALSIRNQVARSNSSGRLLLAVVVLISVAMSLNGLFMVRRQHAAAVSLQIQVKALADDVGGSNDDRPILVSTNTHLGRHMWKLIEDIDFVLVPSEDFRRYMERFAATDVTRFGLAGGLEQYEEYLVSLGFRVVERQSPQVAILERDAP